MNGRQRSRLDACSSPTLIDGRPCIIIVPLGTLYDTLVADDISPNHFPLAFLSASRFMRSSGGFQLR